MPYNIPVILSGKEIAQTIYQQLQKRVERLQQKNITPHLVVILIGENPASVSYVNQKKKKGEAIGCTVTVLNYDESITTKELETKVTDLNSDPTVHGLLIQRPVPDHVDIAKLENMVDPAKDVDGFHPEAPYTFPIPMAVMRILEEAYDLQPDDEGVARSKGLPIAHSETTSNEHDGKETETGPRQDEQKSPIGFMHWLQNKQIVVIGKGPTGGGPIMDIFKKEGIAYTMIDSKTTNREELLKNADIIISAVGKENIIKAHELKQGVILIGVGILRGADGKLHGDYHEEEIAGIASYYTTTPGGVGPVNVAMLFENVLTAAETQTTAAK